MDCTVPAEHTDGFVQVESRGMKRRRTPALFDGYTSDSSDASTVLSSRNVQEKVSSEKVPPIVIPVSPDLQWQNLLTRLKNANAFFDAKFVGLRLYINCVSVASFRAVQRELTEAKVQFYAYSLQEDAELKAVLRGLPPYTTVDEIKVALQEKGFVPSHVAPLERREGNDRHPTNTFYVRCRKTGTWAEIWKMTHLLGVKVSVSPFEAIRGVPQCYNCQRFNHGSQNCHLAPRCVRCAGPHRVRQCPEPHGSAVKCCNCGASHSANYKGCSAYKKAKEAQRRRQTPRPAQQASRKPSVSRPQPLPPSNYVTVNRNMELRPQVPVKDAPRNTERSYAAAAATRAPVAVAPLPAPRPTPRPRRKNRRRHSKSRPVTSVSVPDEPQQTIEADMDVEAAGSVPAVADTSANVSSVTDASVTATESPAIVPAAHDEPTAQAGTTITVGAVMKWISTIVPLILGPQKSPTELLAAVMLSFNELLSNG